MTSAPDTDKDETAAALDRKTHIEVCIRIRPLVIASESSNSFLIQRNEKPTTPSASRRGATRTPRSGGSPNGGFSSSSSNHQRKGWGLFKRSHSPDPEDGNIVAWERVGDTTVRQSPQTNLIQGRTHTYTLDQVYGPTTQTKDVFDRSVQDLVHAAVDGYHTSVLAYGQTSTGKTHTMTGTTKEPGLIPMAVQECFRYIEKQVEPKEYLLRVSYLEVYKEHIKDLLATSETAPPVRLFDSADGLVIKGLREEVVTSPEDVFRILAQGESRRQVGATSFNQHSSRSHVIVRLWIEGRAADDAPSSTSSKKGKPSTSSSLSLVDLAGSESVRLSGSSERRQEGHYINQSLMTLGKIVYALSEIDPNDEGNAKKKHIPYRDSKLTRLLQPSLSGNAQVVLICCISPMVNHLEESHNTFKFAIRAKKIPQKAEVQETADEQTLLQSYRQEINDLRQQLADLKSQHEAMASTASTVSSSSSVDLGQEDEMTELAESIKKLEHLIIRSKAIVPNPEDLIDFSDRDNENDDEMQTSLLALATQNSTESPQRTAAPSTPVSSPRDEKTDKDMEAELSRIQGILGSVLKKRRDERSTDQEVKLLRAQLEKQEETVSLRKADASFLQRQLEEKDDLLQEVSKLLEAVEIRQSELERENQRLRFELDAVKSSRPLPTRVNNPSSPASPPKLTNGITKKIVPPIPEEPEKSEEKPVQETKASTASEKDDSDNLDDLLGPVLI